ncbi:conserved membrane hypothetical protein [Candidatus Desulfarcum epimagneticum]|uniref:Metal-dependent hydrolase n=1 Tax=uncultured Desulfobacteraceae bacterium TaxID=218296 RepID=A0A484HLD5_9BACT|nr:conserved membrane hypothetical protein [uncultured Desulfobacteraceae bacterium]
MAGFKAHAVGGVAAGAGFSALGFYAHSLSLPQAAAVAIVGAVSGLLPDLDSDTGKPLAFMFHFISVLIPSLLFSHAARLWGTSPELVLCYFSISYVAIRHVGCALIKKLTVHRGVMHSVPFAVLCAGVGYLLFSDSGKDMARLCALTVFFGCMLHLLMDELNAFTVKFGFIPVLKRSTGTAMKLKSDSLPATLLIYFLAAGVWGVVVLRG